MKYKFSLERLSHRDSDLGHLGLHGKAKDSDNSKMVRCFIRIGVIGYIEIKACLYSRGEEREYQRNTKR
ncbi:MAG: hypothetical protein ACE5KZ_04985 [Candidatus Scalinduaceae bacterium]